VTSRPRGEIGTDRANTFPPTIKTSLEEGLFHPDPVHYVTKHLLQGIGIDGLQSFNTARRTIAGFKAS
jgi:hypothetical protein